MATPVAAAVARATASVVGQRQRGVGLERFVTSKVTV